MTAVTDCPRCYTSKVEPVGVDRVTEPCRRCGGIGVVPLKLISKNFTNTELWGHSRRPAPGAALIPNDTTPEQDEDARLLAVELLEPGRAGVGGFAWTVTSWFRCRPLDALVAQDRSWVETRTSAHAIAAAADVFPHIPGLAPMAALQQLMEWYLHSGLAWDQAIIEFGCLHIARRAPVAEFKQRQMFMVRAPKVPAPPPGKDRWIYEPYTGKPEQMARVG